MNDKPAYISFLRRGEIDARPPAFFEDVKGYTFVLDASKASMQKLVDDLLKPATLGRVSYEVAAPATLVTFMDVARCGSTPENIGWLPVRECEFWVPLVERRTAAPQSERLVMWAPYIFINGDIGLATGREVWGWPKSLARITVATDAPAAPAHFGCETNIMPVFDPAQPMRRAELFSIAGTVPIDAPPGGIGGFLEVLTALFGELAALAFQGWQLKPQLPAIALKQFRDSAAPGRACYQAIVNSPCEVTKLTGGHMLADTFTLKVTTCESHTIVADIFGRAPDAGATKLPVKLAGVVNFEMVAEPGEVVVEWP
jgi:hypothetical protein